MPKKQYDDEILVKMTRVEKQVLSKLAKKYRMDEGALIRMAIWKLGIREGLASAILEGEDPPWTT